MKRKKKLNKESVAEDWCFVCKDGGLLRICDYGDCLKACHPQCVDKDDSLLENDERWTCDWHRCSVCNKPPTFYCFCCPLAVCSYCFNDAEFAVIRKNKGLCDCCLELAWLIEEKKDADSTGSKVDFYDQGTVEFFFYGYWEEIKKKESLTSEQVILAYNQLKKGSDSHEHDEVKEVTSESDDEFQLHIFDDYTDRCKQIRRRKRMKGQLSAMKRKAKSKKKKFIRRGSEVKDGTSESESDDEFQLDIFDDDTDGCKQIGRRKSMKRQLSVIKRKAKSKKKKFIGWGSEPLLEFLASISKDTSTEMSQYAVMDIIIEYCKKNKLFDPEIQKKINFDARLQTLLGRKSVNRNSIYNLLTPHLADNLELSEDELEFFAENIEEDDLAPRKRQQQSRSNEKSNTKAEVVNFQKSCFASMVPKNIKLLYLRKSLVEELSKQLETFEAKVTGTFLRVKCDPKDHLQKNSHMLVQVIGVQKTSTMNSEIMLQVSNMVKEVPIRKLSDDDFTEEECEDLHQRVKNGKLKRPTVVELEQKARSLHEEITNHWISRELVLLQRRIDRANEKGWRKEFCEYLDSLQLLQKPEEQLLLLREVPEVIADDVDPEPVLENSMIKYEQEQNDGSLESALGRTTETPCCDLKCNGTSCCQNGATNAAGIEAKDACNVDGTKELESVIKYPQDCKYRKQYMRKKKKELQSVVKDLNKFNSVVKDVEKI
ncbi:hypothetical protein Ddye_021385 [Dipteronia dyeriana]|uniref:Uncharacterized protein n=1 Tax=Dipteronia dyeriana TaxID=168575 RepID=A0AAD9U1I2_9ROSI|nr:hypothetical protein Ddye_021385 [Dipteronia dyeriana]